jgi:riboflavin transporter FmnP
MRVLAPATVFVLAIQVFGIYLAGAAYIGVFMRWLGRYSLVVSSAVGLAVMTFFFLLFEVWFKVPLYKGLLDPLAFLGY